MEMYKDAFIGCLVLIAMLACIVGLVVGIAIPESNWGVLAPIGALSLFAIGFVYDRLERRSHYRGLRDG